MFDPRCDLLHGVQKHIIGRNRSSKGIFQLGKGFRRTCGTPAHRKTSGSIVRPSEEIIPDGSAPGAQAVERSESESAGRSGAAPALGAPVGSKRRTRRWKEVAERVRARTA